MSQHFASPLSTSSAPPRRGRSRFTAAFTSAVVVAAGAAGGLGAGVSPAAAADTTTFTYTGGEQTYTVPTGVHALSITAYGAPGGSGPKGAGGGGAVVDAIVPVVAGTTLYVQVGGVGSAGGAGGFNGGGHGVAGGGGGASDVRTQPRSVSLTALDSRLVVAGGGGGTAYGTGGYAGHTSVVGAGDGGKGSIAVAGPGGDGGLGPPAGLGGKGRLAPDGDDGTLGSGGASSLFAGGGGGGGYYGGGGGGGGPVGGGGGAGSSYWVPTATATMWGNYHGAPMVEITPLPAAMATALLLKDDVAALDLPPGIEKKLLAKVAEVRAAVAADDPALVLASVDRLVDMVHRLRGNVLRHSADEWQDLVARATTVRDWYTS